MKRTEKKLVNTNQECSIQDLPNLSDTDFDQSLNSLLDQSLPIDTEHWKKVEQLLNYLTEFAPTYKIIELTEAICNFADDQAKRGFELGKQEILSDSGRRAG